MKKLKFLLPLVASALMFAGCESFLDTELHSGTFSQEQFTSLDDYLDIQVKGMYNELYSYGGDHDMFGQKSADLVTDMMSCDMALTGTRYGWYANVAQLQNATFGGKFTAYYWGMYYRIIKNANLVIAALQKTDIVAKDYLNNPPAGMSETEKLLSSDYAQALTMRGFAYFQLASLYTFPISSQADIATRSSVILYDENSKQFVTNGASSLEEVYMFVEKDLKEAKQYFSLSNTDRSSKIIVNKDIASAYLAYTYLQWGKYPEAYQAAKDVITNSTYQVIPLENVLTTGFVDINNNSWMWGVDVNTETTTGLASFWGQLDIHTYSYAFAGDKKVIDANLFTTIASTDKRKEWFDRKNSKVPDGKFFDLEKGVGAKNIDRDWVNDIVYMRIEEMYLIAAEASARATQPVEAGKTNIEESRFYLKALLDQRDPTVAATLSGLDKDPLLAEIALNWRIEMWGEGRALLTMKRFKQVHTRGDNHRYYSGEDIEYNDQRLTFPIPYGEDNSNPNINITED